MLAGAHQETAGQSVRIVCFLQVDDEQDRGLARRSDRRDLRAPANAGRRIGSTLAPVNLVSHIGLTPVVGRSPLAAPGLGA